MSTAAVIIVGQLVLVLLCTEILVGNLPASLFAAMRANCLRLDGSESSFRAHIEAGARHWVRHNLYVTMLVLLLPVNFLAYVVHTQVIPFSIGMDAILAFQLPADAWKDALRHDGVEEGYDQWQAHESHGMSRDEALERKRMLWSLMPLILGFGMAWVAFSAWAVKSIFFASVRAMAKDAAFRAEQYLNRDLTRLADN